MKNKVIGAVVLSSLLVLGVASTAISVYIKENAVEKTFNKDYSIKENGIGIKALNTVKNDDGTVTKTFRYTVTPANASNQVVTASIKYTDNTDCSAVMTVAVDTSTKIITLHNLAAFSKVINCKIVSSENSAATATISLDFEKKVTNIAIQQYIGLGVAGISGIEYYSPVNITTYNQPAYSVFTKDKNYTYTVSFKNRSNNSFDTAYIGGTTAINNSQLCTLIEDCLINKTNLTAQQIWDSSSLNSWHSILKSSVYKSGDWFEIHVPKNNLSIKVNETNEEYLNNTDLQVAINIGSYDFTASTFAVATESLSAEVYNIIF